VVAPSGIVAICENCGETIHRVLKGKVTGRHDIVFQGTVKCQKCGSVKNITQRELRPLKIPMILSWMQESEKFEIEVDRGKIFNIGDLIEIKSGKVELTSIESKGKRVQTSYAYDIDTLWAKRIDKVKVKVTIAKGGKSFSKELLATPDEEFCVGDILEFGRLKTAIQQIMVEGKTLYKGCAEASEIKRLYARAVKVKESY